MECKIVFEIGPTHSGFESAKKLIKEISACGGNAVKMQMITADELMNDPSQLFEYSVLNQDNQIEYVSESLHAILKRRELTEAQWISLIKYSKELGLEFYTTVTTETELEFALKAGVDSIKIASGDITYLQLIKSAAKTGLPIQLDTGNADFKELDAAISTIREQSVAPIVVHHCPPGYPAKDEDVYLNTLQIIRQKFEVDVAFSDHSAGWHMDIAALAIGAKIIEKTLTMNKFTRSPEHIFSLDPIEARKFVQEIRSVEKALVPGFREIDAESKKRALQVRRSPYLARDISQGETIYNKDVIFQRPGIGLEPILAEKIFGKKAKSSLKKGQLLLSSDFEITE